MDALADEIAKIKALFFRGIIQINLIVLNFKHPLARNYYHNKNFIKAIINNNMLTEALKAPSLKVNIFYHRLESIGEIPKLLLLQVDYLNDLYRINGEIFYKIRQYYKIGDEKAKKTIKDLRQLLKDKRFIKAFNLFTKMPRLYLKCNNKLLNYLSDSNILISAIDTILVQNLELYIPTISKKDRLFIINRMRSKDIFPTITDLY
ncbi:hypothetical protein V2W45_1471624 [Cenococcum geophilum]